MVKKAQNCAFLPVFTICINFLIVGSQGPRDNGLKLFLEREDMERLYDFEEECVEGYFREQEKILNQSTEEKIGNTKNKVEHMAQKIEDINQKENIQTVTVQVLFFKYPKRIAFYNLILPVKEHRLSPSENGRIS